MSVHTLLSVSALLRHSVTTLWAPTSAPAVEDTLMFTPAALELVAQVGVTVCLFNLEVVNLLHTEN